MNEATISCPTCKAEIKLTESLAAPLVEAARREYEQRLEQANLECTKREERVRLQEQTFTKAKREWQASEQERFQRECERISEEESRRATMKFSLDLVQKSEEIQHLQQILKGRDERLVEAQEVQAECLRKERELNDQRRELDLTVEKRVQDSLATVQKRARLEAEEDLKLKVSEKEQTIASMRTQIDDLKRRAEQGSQQLQGEVQELELQALLIAKFAFDSIEPVRKGEHGGDVLQRVVSSQGQRCGTILWEAKRTRNWSDGWLPKLREDQRNAKADIAVIVSHALPKDLEGFDLIDNVWVTHTRNIIPLACILRHSLIEIETARRQSEGQQSKAELVYQYLSGPRFRHRMQAIVEGFTGMQADLEKEKRAILKQWAKRDEQIQRVMQSTVGMYGDLQGIAGQTLLEIEGLELEDASAADGPSSMKRIA